MFVYRRRLLAPAHTVAAHSHYNAGAFQMDKIFQGGCGLGFLLQAAYRVNF